MKRSHIKLNIRKLFVVSVQFCLEKKSGLLGVLASAQSALLHTQLSRSQKDAHSVSFYLEESLFLRKAPLQIERGS